MSINWQGLLGQGATTAAQYEMLESAKRDAAQIPGQIMQGMETVSGMARPYTEFKPFTVTSPTGATSTVGPQGMTSNLSAQQQQLVDSLQQQAATQAGMIGQVTPEQLMSQMQALRAPEQERAQLGLENRLAAQGRLGLQTAAYGGAPEQLAMQKAIQEQQSADALGAISQARQLQGMDIQNLTGMLGAAGIPQQQLTAAMQPSLTGMTMAQQPAQLQAQAISNLGQQQLAGIPSAMNAEALLRQAQLEGMTNLLMPQMNKEGNLVDTAIGTATDEFTDWLKGLLS